MENLDNAIDKLGYKAESLPSSDLSLPLDALF